MDINPNNSPLIAGQNAGKKLRCRPKLKSAYDRLQQAALRGNHWARIAVRELHALTTGPAGKTNIYIKPGERDQATGSTKLVVFLPGLKATVMRWSNDQYCVTDLVLDAMYFEAISRNEKRTGLYRVSTQDSQWQTEYVADGLVKAKDGRVVAIGDSGFGDAKRAAERTVPATLKVLGAAASVVRSAGCDLHFTAGTRELGGLLRYNAINNENGYGSAVLLAESMYQARKLTGVVWVADHGGAVVLTQAFRILVDRGVKLEGHTAYLNHPTSSPGDALKLAHKLELTLNEAFANTGWSPVGAISQYKVAGARLAKKEDPYNRGYHAQSLITGITKAMGPMSLVGTGAVALGASIPMVATVSAIVMGAAGIASHANTVYTLGQSVKETVTNKIKR